ncbi:MAG: DUF2971 domain-containing protein [Methanobrevibacter sp.]|nr:DUF2971 domain-containing protein [Methanobrevibacter sp.]
MPKALYKYKSIDANGYAFDLLETDLIFLSNANNLNDLYEGEIFYDNEELLYNRFKSNGLPYFMKKTKFNINQKEQIKNSKNPYLDTMKIIYETDDNINSKISFNEFNNDLSNFILGMSDDILKNGNIARKENTYLTCFSENQDIKLMWAHYTDNNKGICIKYNIKDYEYLMHVCYPIKYEDGYDYTEELSNFKEHMYKLAFDPYLRKETDWSYEKEWRLLFNHEIFLRNALKLGDKYFLKLPKPSAIYLGKRISSENKRKIFDICKKREISLYQMEKDSREAKLYEIEILKYSEKSSENELFIVESIKNKTCKSIIRDYFYYPILRNIDIEKRFSKIIDSFNKLTDEEIQFFLEELLFKNNIYPVLYPYYTNVLLFLIKLYDNKSFNHITTIDGLSIEKNLEKWIGYCISSFYNKKIVRYLIFFERLFMRFYNRYVILSDKEKESYERELFNYNLKNNYVTLIEDDTSDESKLMHPFTNENQKELIRNNILDNIQRVIDLFYINGHFDEDGCYEEYLKLKLIVEKIESNTKSRYQEIFLNSKDQYIIGYDNLFNKSYDIQLENTGLFLTLNKHILQLISPKDKMLFEILGKINYNHEITKFIFECCNELNIPYKEDIMININDYFNPKTNPYILYNNLKIK